MPITGRTILCQPARNRSDLGVLGEMTRKRFLSWTAALLVAVLSVAACTSSKEQGGTSSVSEVRIGVLVPKSGASADAGVEALHGAELAAGLINGDEGAVSLAGVGSGGLAGLGGAKLSIVSADTKSNPKVGATEAARLVTQQHAVALVGAYDTDVTDAASQRTERQGIPFVNGDSPADFLTERGLDWFFRTGPTDRMFGEAFYSTLQQEKVRPKRISMLYTTDAPGESLHRVLHILAPEANYDEHGMVKFPLGKPNLVPELQELRDVKKPEVLFLMTSTASDAVRVLKTMQAMRYRPPQIFAFGRGVYSEPQVLQAAGTAGEGLYYGTAWSREIAGRSGIAKAVMERYEQRYNRPMSETAAGTFTAVLVLADAIDKAGSTDPQRVRAALLNLNIPGRETIMPWSGVRFDASRQNVAANGVVEQRVGQAFRVVFPPELQGAAPAG
jgi:branched-chain amino acid transport system substrate-binding protein